MDKVMETLLSPETGTLLAASDHEIDRTGHRIVFTETWIDTTAPGGEMYTWVYVIAVDPTTGDWPTVAPPFDAWFSYGLVEIDTTGEAIALFVPEDFSALPPGPLRDMLEQQHSVFPNGAEWSKVMDQPPAIYYSARTQRSRGWQSGYVAEIRYSVDQAGTFTDPVAALFDMPGQDRFLLSCLTSDALTDRVLFYVRSPLYAGSNATGWQSNAAAAGCWCVHDAATNSPILERDEFAVYPIAAGVRVRSTPVRQIPDLYAILLGLTNETGTTLDLCWFELRSDLDQNVGGDLHQPYPPSTKLLRTYDLAGEDLALVGLGARRSRAHGDDVFVLYAVFSRPTAIPGVRTTFYDTFLVRYSGDLSPGRGILDARIADAETAVTFLSAKRVTPVVPPPRTNYLCIVDDESWEDDAGQAFIVCMMAPRDTDAPVESVVVTVEAHPGPVMAYSGPGAPLPEEFTLASTISDTNRVVRMDPEVMRMTGGNFMVYYQQQFAAGSGTFLLPAPRDPPERGDDVGLEPLMDFEEREIVGPGGEVIVIRIPVLQEPDPLIQETDLTWDEYNQFRRADA